MNNKKSLKKTAIILGIIIALFLALVLALVIIYKIIFPSSKTEFNSVDEFVSAGGYVYYDVPECAENLRYYYRETPFYGFRSIISFEINDSEEYDIFMEDLKDYVFFNNPSNYYPDGTPLKFYPEWEGFDTDPLLYTEEELEEMAYLEQNYTNMNYKEMLSLSDHKYGFLHGYGAKLRDYRMSPYNDAFPVFDWYDYAVDGSLDDYTVINYNFVNGTGSVVLVDEENRQFVIIRLVSL